MKNKPKKFNTKEVLISIVVGACVAFFTSLFEGLAEFLKTHSADIMAGTVSTAVYLGRAFRS